MGFANNMKMHLKFIIKKTVCGLLKTWRHFNAKAKAFQAAIMCVSEKFTNKMYLYFFKTASTLYMVFIFQFLFLNQFVLTCNSFWVLK